MYRNHEIHDGLPIWAGLALITWAAVQLFFNAGIDSGLLAAAALHNLMDGGIVLLASTLELAIPRLERRHAGLNVAPLMALAFYLAIVIVIAVSVLLSRPTRFGWELASIEALDAVVNLSVRLLSNRKKSSIAAAMSVHLLMDAVVAPLLLVVSLLPLGWMYRGGTLVLVTTIALFVGHEAHEEIPHLHFHRQTNCPNRKNPDLST